MNTHTDLLSRQDTVEFPWGVYIGDLFHPEYEDIPVLLPTSQGGVIIEYDESDEQLCNSLIENVCLSLARLIQPDLLTFHIFDYSRQKRFIYLSELAQQEWYHIYTDNGQADLGFNKLDAESLNRHQQYFSIHLPDIATYNQHHIKRPLAYRVLIINLEYFPNERISIKRFKDFIKSAITAGYYIIMMKSNELQTDEYKRLYQSLYETLPTLSLQQQKFILNSELFTHSELQTKYGFDFRPIGLNRLLLLEQLQESKQKDSRSEQDFLKVPIAMSSDGRNELYFRLGEACTNYHAVITGSTGTGKSVLLNNLITKIAEQYTADEIRLDLMDFKQGVEFQSFITHPNVEHLFLENADKQSAIDLLTNFVIQGQRLGELFRQAEVKNISEYNNKHPDKRLPYRLLVIDEVQNLYEGMDYRQSQVLNNLLDNILRQGRAWGNHLIICTQSLKGTQLPKRVINSEAQLRLTLKLNREEDAMESMGYDNAKIATKLQKYEVLINTAGGNDRTANQIGFVNPPLDIGTILTAVHLRRQHHQKTKPIVVSSSPDSSQTEHHKEKSLQTPIENSVTANIIENISQFDNQKSQKNDSNIIADKPASTIFANREVLADNCIAEWDKELKEQKGK